MMFTKSGVRVNKNVFSIKSKSTFSALSCVSSPLFPSSFSLFFIINVDQLPQLSILVKCLQNSWFLDTFFFCNFHVGKCTTIIQTMYYITFELQYTHFVYFMSVLKHCMVRILVFFYLEGQTRFAAWLPTMPSKWRNTTAHFLKRMHLGRCSPQRSLQQYIIDIKNKRLRANFIDLCGKSASANFEANFREQDPRL